MANWSLPSVSDIYANVIAYINAKFEDAAKMFDGTGTNLPDGTIRWNSSSAKFEIYESSGGTWSDLAATYAIKAAQAGNADQLNSQDPSYYATAAGLADLAFGGLNFANNTNPGYHSTATSCAELIDNGWWYVPSTWTDAPYGAGVVNGTIFNLCQHEGTSKRIRQYYYAHYISGGYAYTRDVWQRYTADSGATWSDWEKVQVVMSESADGGTGVMLDANGDTSLRYLYASLINLSKEVQDAYGADSFAFFDASGWLRKKSAPSFRASLGLGELATMDEADLTIPSDAVDITVDDSGFSVLTGTDVQTCLDETDSELAGIPYKITSSAALYNAYGSTTGFTLPAGGTWAWMCNVVSGTGPTNKKGVSAGETTVSWSPAATISLTAWRVA